MRCDAADMCVPPAVFCFFRPTNEQMKVNPNISTLFMVYVFGILDMILEIKKKNTRKKNL